MVVKKILSAMVEDGQKKALAMLYKKPVRHELCVGVRTKYCRTFGYKWGHVRQCDCKQDLFPHCRTEKIFLVVYSQVIWLLHIPKICWRFALPLGSYVPQRSATIAPWVCTSASSCSRRVAILLHQMSVVSAIDYLKSDNISRNHRAITLCTRACNDKRGRLD